MPVETQQVVITKRLGDYKVYLERDVRIWGAGKSQDEALGSLVRSYPERFGLAIKVR